MTSPGAPSLPSDREPTVAVAVVDQGSPKRAFPWPWRWKRATHARVGLISLAVILIAGSVAMYFGIDYWKAESALIEGQAEADGISLSVVLADIAELEAESTLFESQRESAIEKAATLAEDTTAEQDITTAWRGTAAALSECAASRQALAAKMWKQSASSLRSTENSINSQCTSALSQYNSLNG